MGRKLTLGGKVSNDAGGDAESNASPWGDETGSGSSSDESRDAT